MPYAVDRATIRGKPSAWCSTASPQTRSTAGSAASSGARPHIPEITGSRASFGRSPSPNHGSHR